MTTPIKAPAPPKTPSVVEQAKASIASAKTGFDPLRPVRYFTAFVGGTTRHTLNGIAKWGRKGLTYGILIGAIIGLMPAAGVGLFIGGMALLAPGVGALTGAIGGGLLGFGIGALSGGAKGLVTGGTREVARIHRGEVYAEDLVQRSNVQHHAAPNKADYRAAYHDKQHQNAVITQQVLEREAEIRRDARTYDDYWQERERHRATERADRGHGF